MAASSRILYNGGFSLRSKNLIRNIGKFLPADDLNRAEDAVICRYLRARLEMNGDSIRLKGDGEIVFI